MEAERFIEGDLPSPEDFAPLDDVLRRIGVDPANFTNKTLENLRRNPLSRPTTIEEKENAKR